MKADLDAQARLLDLQEVDTVIAQLKHKRSSLPEHEQIAGAKSKWAQISEQFVACETELSDAEKALARAESDLTPVRERLALNTERVDSGAIADPKALRAMVEENEHLVVRIGTLEDAQLEAMEAVETAAAERDRVNTERKALHASIKELMARRDKQTADIDQDLASREAQRETIAARLPADLLAAYTKTATRLGGRGVARLEGARCTGCGIEANAADKARYDAAPATELLRCEECGRLMVRS